MSTDSTDISAKGATTVRPLPAPLRGDASVPGDKSVSHRAILLSAMAEGSSSLAGVLDSADVRSTMAAVSALGARVDLEKQDDGSFAGRVVGWGAEGPRQPEGPIDCGNSGTTVRLLMGILAPWGIDVQLTGDSSLQRRPMGRITAPLRLMGACFEPEDKGTLPLTVAGTKRAGELRGISYDMPVASAQMKTAILLAGAFAQGVTRVQEPAPSRNHTELMLPEFGVQVEHDECFAEVAGGQSLHAARIQVPGDPSSAAFLACAAALLPGSDISVRNVGVSPARVGFARVLERMGACIRVENEALPGKEPCGTVSVRYVDGLSGCDVLPHEIASMVDEIPVLALVAAHAEGVTRFKGAGELRVKEADRFAAIQDGLAKLGVETWCENDADLCIRGNSRLRDMVPEGLEFDSLGDHRLAMTWALVALTGVREVRVRNFEAVEVSYPGFLDDMTALAGCSCPR